MEVFFENVIKDLLYRSRTNNRDVNPVSQSDMSNGAFFASSQVRLKFNLLFIKFHFIRKKSRYEAFIIIQRRLGFNKIS
jgi:hypothetical protein